MVVKKYRLIEAGILSLYPANNNLLKITLISHHFNDKGCQIFKYRDIVEF